MSCPLIWANQVLSEHFLWMEISSGTEIFYWSISRTDFHFNPEKWQCLFSGQRWTKKNLDKTLWWLFPSCTGLERTRGTTEEVWVCSPKRKASSPYSEKGHILTELSTLVIWQYHKKYGPDNLVRLSHKKVNIDLGCDKLVHVDGRNFACMTYEMRMRLDTPDVVIFRSVLQWRYQECKWDEYISYWI